MAGPVGPMGVLSFRQVPPEHPEAVALFGEAWRDARLLYPESHPGLEPPVGNPGDWRDTAYVLMDLDGRPVASGALRGGATGGWVGTLPELKRIYVHRAMQGQGLGRRMVAHLLGLAEAWGAPAVVLETGCRQAPALGLYASMGFERIPPYGGAIGDELSVCMRKVLDEAAWRQRQAMDTGD